MGIREDIERKLGPAVAEGVKDEIAAIEDAFKAFEAAKTKLKAAMEATGNEEEHDA
jgi:hypothetical protein